MDFYSSFKNKETQEDTQNEIEIKDQKLENPIQNENEKIIKLNENEFSNWLLRADDFTDKKNKIYDQNDNDNIVEIRESTYPNLENPEFVKNKPLKILGPKKSENDMNLLEIDRPIETNEDKNPDTKIRPNKIETKT